jgi:hypothetical protein
MFSDNDGVVLRDGRCSIVLHPTTTPAPDSHFEHRADLVAGPFRGTMIATAYHNGYPRFRSRLVSLYATLSGQAVLDGYENLDIALTGDGLGHVDVEVTATAELDPLIRLRFHVQLDQTQLPEIIVAIDRTFMPVPPGGVGAS